MLNNDFLLDQARFLAERTREEAGSDSTARIERIWHLAFGRAPDAEESRAALQFVDEQGWTLFARAILNANEFVYVF